MVVTETGTATNDAWRADMARRTPMAGHTLSWPRGWDDIVRETHEAMVSRDPKYRIEQVSEKFGELRYRCSSDTALDVREVTRAARERSRRTCQACGAPGVLVTSGACRTVCEEHSTTPSPGYTLSFLES